MKLLRSRHTTALLVLTLPLALGCDAEVFEPGLPRWAVVRFAFDGFPEDTLRVLVRDPATVQQAIRYVREQRGPRIPVGPIRRGSGIDGRYPFHFDADRVRLAEVAMEVCDGRPMRTPEEVDAFMRMSTGLENPEEAQWCPWGAYPVAVEGSAP